MAISPELVVTMANAFQDELEKIAFQLPKSGIPLATAAVLGLLGGNEMAKAKRDWDMGRQIRLQQEGQGY
jgi:hypothetical protein